MRHDEHFLGRLSRVDSERAALALRLYQDSNLVQDIVRFAGLHEHERVALPIAEGSEPPHLIVARNGHFVTCLGPGMSTRWPVVPWSVVRTGILQGDSARVMRATPREEMRRVYTREWTGSGDVAREDLAPLAAVVPIGRKTNFLDWLACFKPYTRKLGRVQRQERKGRASEEDLGDLWRHRWELAHRAVLLLVSDPDGEWMLTNGLQRQLPHFMFASDGGLGGYMSTAARFVWAMTQMGEHLFDDLVRTREDAEWPGEAGLCGIALGVIAHREPRLRKRAMRVLAEPVLPVEGEEEGPLTWAEGRRVDALVSALLAAPQSTWSAFLGKAAGWALERLRRERGEEAEAFSADDLLALALASVAPTPHPSAWLSSLVGFIPALATARALDLYLPRAWMPAGGSDVDHARALLARAPKAEPETVRAEPKPGRNEPCACGSGKKAKRCCLAS